MTKAWMPVAALLVATALVMSPAAAATAKQQAQQAKMKDCNAQADAQGLKGAGKGAERQAFMKTCLAAGSDAAAAPSGRTAQQEKMKTCNADATAKGLKGADRQKFMSGRLSAQQ